MTDRPKEGITREVAPCGCVSVVVVHYVNGMNLYEAIRTPVSSCAEHAATD